MSQRYRLADLIPTFPSLREMEDPQSYLIQKEEFAELRDTGLELPPSQRGQKYLHQTALARLMMITDRLLIRWEQGTGKSCGIGAVTESLKELFQTSEYLRRAQFSESSQIRRCYILVRGPDLVNEFKDQLVRVCTRAGEYDSITSTHKSRMAQKAAISRELSKWYEIIPYGQFTNRLAKITSDTELLEEYDNSFFYVDEVHNLRVESGQDLDEPGDKELRRAYNRNKAEGKQTYNQLYRLFHLLRRSKVVIGSGSVMVNDPSELGPLMNLILSIEQQFPDNFPYLTAKLPEYLPFIKGLVSYVRASNLNIQVESMGTPYIYKGTFIPVTSENRESRNNLVQTEMIGRQREIYLKYTGNIRNNVYQSPKQASRMVFPNGTIGNEAYRYWAGEYKSLRRAEQQRLLETSAVTSVGAQSTGKSRRTRKPVKVVESREQQEVDAAKYRELGQRYQQYLDYLRNPQTLRQLSATYSNILSIELDAAWRGFLSKAQLKLGPSDRVREKVIQAQQRQQQEQVSGLRSRLTKDEIDEAYGMGPGCSFIASDYVDIGANTLDDVFLAAGFEPFTESKPIFEIDAEDPYNEEKVERRSRLDKRPRYAVITPAIPDTVYDTIRTTFNSYENRHGEYIQILIGSPVIKEAVNILHTIRDHTTPAWNPSTTQQAKSRILRAGGHQDLIEDKQRLYAANGLDPQLATITIQDYNHAATLPDQDTIDTYMNQISEQKEANIIPVDNILKVLSVDYWIHVERNFRQPISNSLRELDQSYHPVNQNPLMGIDTSTYDILYYQEIVQQLIPLLKDYFTSHVVATVQDLIENITWDQISQIPHRIQLSAVASLGGLSEQGISETDEESLKKELEDNQKKLWFIVLATEQMITERITITNRYGQPTYLRIDNNIYYTTRDHPLSLEASYDNHYYEENLIANLSRPLGEIIDSQLLGVNDQYLEKLRLLSPTTTPASTSKARASSRTGLVSNVTGQSLEEILSPLKFDRRIAVIETVLMSTDPRLAVARDQIRQKYKHAIFEFKEPTEALNMVSQALQSINEKKRQGRDIVPGGKKMQTIAQEAIPAEIVQSGRRIILHNLWNRYIDRTKSAFFDRVKKAGRLRIMPEGQYWRNLLFNEHAVYESLINGILEERFAPYNQRAIFAIQIDYYNQIMTPTGPQVGYKTEFAIQNRLAERLLDPMKLDKRALVKGRSYQSYNLYQLFDILWTLQVNWPTSPIRLNYNGLLIRGQPIEVPSREVILQNSLQFLLSQTRKTTEQLLAMDEYELKFYYVWAIGSTHIQISDIKEIIREAFYQREAHDGYYVYREVN